MRLVFGHDADVVRWLEAKMDNQLLPPWTGIAVVDDAGMIRGAHVLQPVTYCTAEWTLYSERAMTHGVVRQFFRHVFDDLNVHRLQIRTARNNRAIRRAAPKWGFRFEGTAKGYWGAGRDALMFAMDRSQCRWVQHERTPAVDADAAVGPVGARGIADAGDHATARRDDHAYA